MQRRRSGRHRRQLLYDQELLCEAIYPFVCKLVGEELAPIITSMVAENHLEQVLEHMVQNYKMFVLEVKKALNRLNKVKECAALIGLQDVPNIPKSTKNIDEQLYFSCASNAMEMLPDEKKEEKKAEDDEVVVDKE